jgi:hypothetical protein
MGGRSVLGADCPVTSLVQRKLEPGVPDSQSQGAAAMVTVISAPLGTCCRRVGFSSTCIDRAAMRRRSDRLDGPDLVSVVRN